MEKITAIIPCRNESHGIARALESVRWCDEILVVDSFSTDDTVHIARQYTGRILEHAYENSAAQKNWAIPQASHPWILLLDADEYVTDTLRDEIRALLGNEDLPCDAYWIRRRNFFMGKEIRFSGWQHDKVIRLFRRDTCRYEEKHVHAEIVAPGGTGFLQGRIMHYTYKDLAHFLSKADRYSTWSAMDAASKTRNPNLYHFVVKPCFRFWKHYFFKLGILDGYRGFIISALAAQGVFMRYVKLYAMRKAAKDANAVDPEN